MLEVKFKKLKDRAVIPSYANIGDAGIDLTAVSKTVDYLGENLYRITYGTGLALAIPNDYVGLLFPRSSVIKFGMSLANSIGMIDSGYRGEVKAVFYKYGELDNAVYSINDRVAQLIILPYQKIQLSRVDELDETDRGDGGFGSSGQ